MLPARSRTLRAVGAFCLVAGVLAIVGAISGWDVRSGTPRPLLWIIGVTLLIVCLPCLIILRPALTAATADSRGLTVTTRNGSSDTVPWNEIAAVTLTPVGPPPHTAGRVLDLRAASDGLHRHRRIGRWAAARGSEPAHLIVAVPEHLAGELDSQLRDCAGARYRLRS